MMTNVIYNNKSLSPLYTKDINIQTPQYLFHLQKYKKYKKYKTSVSGTLWELSDANKTKQ